MKNAKIIEKSINDTDLWDHSKTPLMKLIESPHCNEEWIKLFLSFGDIKEFQVKIDLNKKDHEGKSVLEHDGTNPNKTKWINLIKSLTGGNSK